MELATRPDRARRLTRPARLAAHPSAQLKNLARSRSLTAFAKSFARLIRVPSATGATRGPQRMLTKLSPELIDQLEQVVKSGEPIQKTDDILKKLYTAGRPAGKVLCRYTPMAAPLQCQSSVT